MPEVTNAVAVDVVREEIAQNVAVQDLPHQRSINFYDNPREIDLTNSSLLDFEPVVDNDRETKRGFHCTMRQSNGTVFSLNLVGFSNFTKAFGIQGAQAMRATPSHLNETIASIARNRSIDNCYAVGTTNHAFTRDLAGVHTMADLMNQYDRRKYSDTKSTSLTLNRVGFVPQQSDQHYIDAILTAAIAFNQVKFNTYTEILRQVCTNGMTRAISSSNKNDNYNSEWIPMAIEHSNRQVEGMKLAIEQMGNARATDKEAIVDFIALSGIPAWVCTMSKLYMDLNDRSDLTAKEQEKLCPFGIRTLWDVLNAMTYACHRISDLATKQKVQERIYKYTFRPEFVNHLSEVGAIA